MSVATVAGDEDDARLRANVRPSDTVARLGGDEFGILLDDISDRHEATLAAERLQACMEAPFEVQSSEVISAISIGIAFSGVEYELPEQILRDADTGVLCAGSDPRADGCAMTL